MFFLNRILFQSKVHLNFRNHGIGIASCRRYFNFVILRCNKCLNLLKMKRAVVGISGGVDSSVAAYLLKKQGYDVVGLFMINWHDTTGALKGDCPWDDDLIFAKLVARKIGIDLHTVDLSKPYRERVVDYMFEEYKHGRTPNPDVLCNREIKFDLFIDEALKLGADYVATGHYCRKDAVDKNGKIIYRLLEGKDPNKDQSYFLCQLNQQQLRKALFPIGHLHKFDVRRIAEEQGFATAEKKDSQGICFVGKVDLPTFLQQKLASRKGRIIEVPETYVSSITGMNGNEHDIEKLCSPYPFNPSIGRQVGVHQGAHFYTIGQNKGLNIGGRPKPSFVIGLDTDKNLIFTGLGKNHPGLYRKGLTIASHTEHWLREDMRLKAGDSGIFLVRIRYRQPLQKAKLVRTATKLFIVFERMQRGITAGQFAAWYKEGELIGSAPIFA